MPNNQRQQAMWVSTGDPETVNDSRLPFPGQLGRYLTVKQKTSDDPSGAEAGRDKEYRYILTDSAMTVAPYKGAVAWWKNKARFMVTTAATNRNARAGVFKGAITPGNWGYIQTGGPSTVKFIDAPTVAPSTTGNYVIPSATAGKADCLAVATAPTHVPLGQIAITPSYNAADMTAVVELDIPDVP